MSTEPLLSARSCGDGIPILIIHGWSLDGNCEALDFEPILRTLSGYQRIYVDLPGTASTSIGDVRNLDDMFVRLVHFVESTIPTSRFLVVGTSCGAYLARALAIKFRRQVDGLLLRVPLVEPNTTKRDIDPYKPLIANAELMAELPPSDLRYMSDMLIQTPECVARTQAAIDIALRPAVETSDVVALSYIRDDPQRYQLSPEHEAATEVFMAPALILTARQDEAVGYRDALRLIELCPRSTFAVLDRESHALPVDGTAVFEALVKDWLYRVSEWQARSD